MIEEATADFAIAGVVAQDVEDNREDLVDAQNLSHFSGWRVNHP